MQNEAGEHVDLYIPRKCSASGRIIPAKDHASMQLNIAEVDEQTGRMTGAYKTYAICGDIRGMGESDDCINRLAKKDGILAKCVSMVLVSDPEGSALASSSHTLMNVPQDTTPYTTCKHKENCNVERLSSSSSSSSSSTSSSLSSSSSSSSSS